MTSDDSPSIFKPDANATPVDQIRPAAPDPRAARVHQMHQRIAEGVRDGSIYREPRKRR